MTKKRLIAGAAAALVIVVATLLIIIEKKNDTDTFNIDLYFFNENNSTIVAENTAIEYDDEDELAGIIIDKLMAGPSDSKNRPIFDENVRLLGINRSGNDMTADFSKEYLTDDNARNFLATYAIVKSLCQIDGIDRVMVTVCGEEIVSPDGTIIGLLSADDIDLVSDTTTQDSKELVLYFGDKSSDLLVRETRTIKITDTIPMEQYVVNELIKGAEKNNARSLLSGDTELISAETTDGTCFVNFKSGFVEKNSGDPKNEKLIIYSVVDSLCELKNVSFVQFLVDGKKTDFFGSIDISGFFIENREMIKQ